MFPTQSITGTHNAANPNSVVSESNDVVASPDTTRPGSSPPRTMYEYCSGPPAAPPPGTVELTALPTSCEVAMSVQCRLEVEIAMSSQTHAKLAASSTAITTNHAGRIFDNSS